MNPTIEIKSLWQAVITLYARVAVTRQHDANTPKFIQIGYYSLFLIQYGMDSPTHCPPIPNTYAWHQGVRKKNNAK